MTDKPGFSAIGGSATLLDDETKTKSPADKAYPLLTEKQIKDILAKEIAKLESGVDQAEKQADAARDNDDEKRYTQLTTQVENLINTINCAKEVRIRIEGNFCTFVLGSLREGLNMAAAPQDVLASVSRLITNSNALKIMNTRRRNNPKGSKMDYSGMGQIIKGKSGEAA